MKHQQQTAKTTTPVREGATSPVLFADRADATPSTTPRCSHLTPATKTKPEHGCRLPRREGSELCVNHQPTDARLSVAELRAVGAYLMSLSPEEATLLFVRTAGLAESKRIAREQTTAPGSN